MAIPKIIHYCWFGTKKMPDAEAGYVAGWKKLLPNYDFMLWNERNFDVSIVPFTEHMAKTELWGFIVDYVRAYAVYNYGGIYLDTDVEVIKPFDDLLEKNICFAGFENEQHVNPGSLFAEVKHGIIAKKIIDFYSKINFMDNDGNFNMVISPKIFTDILLNHGLKLNNTYQKLDVITVYPKEYFSPKSYITGLAEQTENTYSIHHYAASWFSKDAKINMEKRWKYFSVFGDNFLSRVLFIFLDFPSIVSLFISKVKKDGIVNAFKYYWNIYILRKKNSA
jgi:mannosyltransferase OCH1-like enzyme